MAPFADNIQTALGPCWENDITFDEISLKGINKSQSAIIKLNYILISTSLTTKEQQNN
jgi:hypothetical protein